MDPQEKDSYIEARRNSRTDYTVSYQRFIKYFDHRKPKLFCFFEGEDDPKYYGSRIEELVTKDTEYINCDGKERLLKVLELINGNSEYEEYKETWTTFFIDSDFDPIEKTIESNLYVTPCYSIENLYLGETVFDRILKSEFGLNPIEDSSDFNKAKEIYRERLKEFNRNMEEFNAWIYLQRAYEKTHINSTKMDIKTIKSIDKLCKVDLEKVQKIYCINSLQKTFPRAAKLAEHEIQEQVKKFSKEDRTKIFRGKLLIQFLRKIIEKIKTEASKQERKIFSKKVKVKLHLSEDNIISELSQYAETPECLKEFLKNMSRKINV